MISTHDLRKFCYFKGRVALSAILDVLDVGPGDEVLLQGFTCVVVPNAIVYRGARPVYLDIDPSTYNLDVDQLRATCGVRWTPDKAKAIIVQHTFGLPADVDTIADFASEHGLTLIEDAAHALGSRYKGREVGTLGDAAFFSSQWTKPVPTGVGGWAVASDPQLANRLAAHHAVTDPPPESTAVLLLAQYLAWKAFLRPSLYWPVRALYRWLSRHGVVVASSTEEELDHQQPAGYMRRMATRQERLLKFMLQHDEERRKRSRALTSRYAEIVSRAGLTPLEMTPDADPVLLRYPIQVADRDRILEEARRRRIEIGDWFSTPVHPSTHGWETLHYRSGLCPVAERVGRDVINLPLNPRVDDAHVRKIENLLAIATPP